MTFAEKLKSVSAEAKKIRENMTFHNPKDFSDNGAERGYQRIKATGPNWEEKVFETARFMRDIYKGDRPYYHLQEAMTTSDFPILLGDVMHKQLLGSYTPWPVTYPAYFRIRELADFRTLHLLTIDGGNARLEKVNERAPYPETAFTEGTSSLAVSKYGRRYSITWEMLINDDLQAFSDRPQLMAQGARFSEEYLATTMVFDAAGPHAGFFTSGNANIITGNPVLSITALQAAFTQLSAKRDSEGNPIMIDMVTLLVPPALEVVANNLMNAIQIWVASGGGSPAEKDQLQVANWLKNRLRVVVNPWIPIITTTGTVGQTEWALIASSGVTRPAFNFGFLRGRRNPELFIKDSDARRLGGGEVPPTEGSFDNDSIDYKVRHVFGASQGDPKMAVASKGTGS